MKLPAVRVPRLSVRALMIVVVVVAVFSLGARAYLARQERLRILRSSSNAIQGSLGLKRDRKAKPQVGKPFPVTLNYNVSLRRSNIPPGVAYPIWGKAWIEDMRTGHAVDGYSFELTLASGGRESAQGTLAWDASIREPGNYRLKHYLYFRSPLGFWQGVSGGSEHLIKITEGE